MRTLVIAPHLDDEALSCGALIRTRVQQGGSVFVMTLMDRKYHGQRAIPSVWRGEVEAFEKAQQILGFGDSFHCQFPEGEPQETGYYKMLMKVEEMLGNYEPDEVIIPSDTDLNQDHRFINEICRIALRPANLSSVHHILMARSFDSAFREPTHYLAFDRATLECKLRAVAAYAREARTLPHPRSPENITAMHRVLGSKCGAEYAEGYDVLLRKETHEDRYHGRDGIYRHQSD
jgi:LmbE family N-acetylglucosaminyl deacetylase